MRPRGRPFPDLPKLHRALELRSWGTADLAAAAGISYSTAFRLVSGRRAGPDKIQKVAKALLDNEPMSTPTGRFVLDEAAS